MNVRSETVQRGPRSFDVVFYLPWIGALLLGEAPAGGAEMQIYMLSKELARRGHRVALITHPTDRELPAEIDGVGVVMRPPRQERRQGDTGARARMAPFLEAACIWRSVSGVDAPIVVQRVAGAETGVVGICARLGGRRFVWSSANVSDFEFERLKRPRPFTAMFHLGVRLSDRIIVQTAEQADLCRERFGREPTVIRSIAEVAEPRRAAPSSFLWVGRLVPYKQPLAYVALARALPEARFRMVAFGAGKQRAAVEEELAGAAAGVSNLEILGARPHADLMPLIEDAVAIVNTSTFEGMPNTFLEGWARGVPALSLSHDPDGVIEREGTGAFAAGSATVLADRARLMWSERANSGDLADRCRDYVQREHSLTRVADQWSAALGLDAAPSSERPAWPASGL